MSTNPENKDGNANIGSKADLKNAASLLLKGGTLVKDPCPKCSGVQVKLKDKVRCINCGNETLLALEPQLNKRPAIHEEKPEILEAVTQREKRPDLADCMTIIEKKIISLAQEIKDENDLGIQKQKAELLEIYVRILEKIAGLSC